eukprot:5602618-Prymnesium_polylepis.1
MAKALDFIDPDKLSMTVVLTAMNRWTPRTARTKWTSGPAAPQPNAPSRAQAHRGPTKRVKPNGSNQTGPNQTGRTKRTFRAQG